MNGKVNRAAALANVSAYDAEGTKRYIDGAPHIKRFQLSASRFLNWRITGGIGGLKGRCFRQSASSASPLIGDAELTGGRGVTRGSCGAPRQRANSEGG